MFIYWLILFILVVRIGIFFEENKIKIVKKNNKKMKIKHKNAFKY